MKKKFQRKKIKKISIFIKNKELLNTKASSFVIEEFFNIKRGSFKLLLPKSKKRFLNGMFGFKRIKKKSSFKVEDKRYKENKTKAYIHIKERLEFFNNFYGYQYNRISIRNQKSRWGSCSSKKNLNFNYKILFLPPEICDYIVVHELCHLKELNHSRFFWDLVFKTIPDYKEIRKKLLKYRISFL